MIIGVTSKRGGTGTTTIALTLSTILAKQFGRKVCLVDLQNNNDIKKITKIDGKQCIQNLLTEYGIADNKFTSLDENICRFGDFDIIPGVSSVITNFLLKKSSKIKQLLLRLNDIYDAVVLDIPDGDLFEALTDVGLDILPLNILDQNILVVNEYASNMDDRFLKGVVILNQVDEKVWPPVNKFKTFLGESKIYTLPFSPQLKSTMNLKGLLLSDILKTEFFKAFLPVCKLCDQKIQEYLELSTGKNIGITLGDLLESTPSKEKRKKPKKRGFFATLFGKREAL